MRSKFVPGWRSSEKTGALSSPHWCATTATPDFPPKSPHEPNALIGAHLARRSFDRGSEVIPPLSTARFAPHPVPRVWGPRGTGVVRPDRVIHLRRWGSLAVSCRDGPAKGMGEGGEWRMCTGLAYIQVHVYKMPSAFLCMFTGFTEVVLYCVALVVSPYI
ncbi:hypothetical protein F4821DRAFT_158542 [Hypoxylon rubiginosum]|uniref:Uncharacterized protein n=1 Tax=Hypoxylon rubiginosum TaxID=110542 RepID=A0ACC0DHD0_9PEZI|nr:hypothetical protein F4821DRAFT_158542 [Hypoxylon rubiginosum]